MVAPSFQSYKVIGDVYISGGKKYIQVQHPRTLNVRQVRWYEDAEYAKLYPEKSQEVATKMAPHRQVLGFGDAGYITIFKGNCDEENDWFKMSSARYTRLWGWYFRSCDEIPALPADVEPIRLDWDKVGGADGELYREEVVKHAVDALVYDESLAQWIGNIGDRIEITVKINDKHALESKYGHTIAYSMSDADGNQFMWITSSKSDWTVGNTYHIRGTVKSQDVRKNVKINTLTRCSEVK